jgi:hypothetical protein
LALALGFGLVAVAQTTDEALGALLVSAQDEARAAISFMDNMPRARRPERQTKINIRLSETRAAIWEAQSLLSAQIARAGDTAKTDPEKALADAAQDRARFSEFVVRSRSEFIEETQHWRR